jgi:hypothetical protein
VVEPACRRPDNLPGSRSVSEAERRKERSRAFVRFNRDYLVRHGPHAHKGGRVQCRLSPVS